MWWREFIDWLKFEIRPSCHELVNECARLNWLVCRLNSTGKLGKVNSLSLVHLQRTVVVVVVVVVVGLPENIEYCASNPRSSEEPERNFTNIWLPLENTFCKAEPLQNRPSEEEFAEEPSYNST